MVSRLGVGIALLLCAAAPGQHLKVVVDGPAAAFVGQPVTFVVRLEYDARWFDEFGVPLARQRLPLPVHLDVPWLLGASDRAVTWRAPAADEPSMPIAVADRVVQAFVVDGGVELRARWLPRAVGLSQVAPVTARYRFAEDWTDDLLRGRQPVSSQDAAVSSPVSSLRVDPLPTPAPPSFTGAVGEFELSATSGGERVAVGDAFQIEVAVRGDGNLREMGGLRVDRLDGFHVQGVVERRTEEPASRLFVVDLLALRPGVTEVPGVPFAWFSPMLGDYVEARAPTVPVVVDPTPAGVTLPSRVRELVERDLERRSFGGGMPWWAWFLFGVVLYGFGWKMLPILRERRRAAAASQLLHALREAPWHDAQAVADAFAEVLAFAVEEPAGAERAVGEQLEAARFGGPMPPRDEVLRAAAAALGIG